MNNENNNWWSRHKKKVFVIGGITIAVAACGIVLYINRDTVIPLAKESTVKISTFIQNFTVIDESKTTLINDVVKEKRLINNGEPFVVRSHKRNLPANWHTSFEKIKLSKKLGITLKPNQTFVCSYTKNMV